MPNGIEPQWLCFFWLTIPNRFDNIDEATSLEKLIQIWHEDTRNGPVVATILDVLEEGSNLVCLATLPRWP